MIRNSKKFISMITSAMLLSGIVFTSLSSYEAKADTIISVNESEDYDNGVLSILDDDEDVESYSAIDYGLCDNVKSGTILHAWCWSFNSIKENLKDIAEAGFTTVQTSPANECLRGDNGGMCIWNESGGGKWEYHYQPTDWKIGNYQLGTRDDFIDLCNEADKYGVKIIVDVLPNHTTTVRGAVSQELKNAAGGEDLLYHWEGFNSISQWENRFYCTNGAVLGLPDVCTENPGFQKYYLNYLNDLIDCGVDGFRYDTAKHIGLPDDPQDGLPKSKGWKNNFWPVALGQESVDGVSLHNKDKMFIYGEVLQSSGSRDGAYGQIMNLTASGYGYTLRDAIGAKNFSKNNLMNWGNAAGASKLVTWVESHDTYCNKGESVGLSDWDIRMCWAVIAARKDGTPLFYSRPDGSNGWSNRWGNNRMGAKGNDQFKDPEVAAVNKFRNAMVGENENLENYKGSNQILAIERGNKGVTIINLGSEVSLNGQQTKLKDGTYQDQVSGGEFVVSGGKFTSGSLKGGKITVLYDAKVSPKVSASEESKVFDTESISVTLNCSNVSKAEYSINGGSKTTFTNGKVLELGKDLENGESVTLTLYGYGDEGTTEATYTYKKIIATYEAGCLYADKVSGWGEMCAYVYDESTGTAKKIEEWPGVKMSYDSESGRYYYKLPAEYQTGNTKVIFTDGNNQYPASRQPGESFVVGKAMKFDGSKIEIKEPSNQDEELVAGNISTDKKSPQDVNTKIKISTEEATGGSGSYTYQYEVDGEIIKEYSTSKYVYWTPEEAGTYTIKVTTKDSKGNKDSKEMKYTIKEVVVTELEFVEYSASPNSVKVDEEVELFAEATGEGTIKYKFVVSKDGEEVYSRSYKTTTTASWTPEEAGEYEITFYAKDDNNEIEKTITYNVSNNVVLKIDKFGTNVDSPAEIGTNIKLGAQATGKGTIKYRFVVINENGVNVYTKAYSTANTAIWTPKEAGTYTLICKVKDESGKELTSKTYNYVVNGSKLVLNSFKTSLESPQEVGTTIKLGAAAEGTGKLRYRYVVLKDGKNVYTRAYSTQHTAKWTPKSEGVYKLVCKVKDETGKEVSKTIDEFVVEEAKELKIQSIKTSLASPQTVGTSIKITATAKSLSGSDISYKFTVYEGEAGWKSLKSFSADNTAVWKPSTSGKAYIWVEAKDTKGNRVTEFIEYQVESKATRVEQTNKSITYTGKWVGVKDTNASANGYRYTNEEGASLSFKFTGSGISIIAPTSNTKGVAMVTIDGQLYEVDLYSTTAEDKKVVFTKTGLGSGDHTITIESIGVKNINSKNTVIAIDAFDILDGTIK